MSVQLFFCFPLQWTMFKLPQSTYKNLFFEWHPLLFRFFFLFPSIKKKVLQNLFYEIFYWKTIHKSSWSWWTQQTGFNRFEVLTRFAPLSAACVDGQAHGCVRDVRDHAVSSLGLADTTKNTNIINYSILVFLTQLIRQEAYTDEIAKFHIRPMSKIKDSVRRT